MSTESPTPGLPARLQVELVNSKSRDVSAVSALVSACAAILALGATIVVGMLGYNATRDSDVRTARAAAYADFLTTHSMFYEFVWANVWWAGTDAPGLPEDQEAAFWTEVADLEAELDSTYYLARALAADQSITDSLKWLRSEEIEVFLAFTCMTSVADADCSLDQFDDGDATDDLLTEFATDGVIAPAVNAEISRLLNNWSVNSDQAREDLIAAASRQLL